MMHSALNNTKLSAHFGVNAFREVHDSEDLLTNDGIACREIYTVHKNKLALSLVMLYTNATMICEINSSFSRPSLVYTLKAMPLS